MINSNVLINPISTKENVSIPDHNSCFPNDVLLWKRQIDYQTLGRFFQDYTLCIMAPTTVIATISYSELVSLWPCGCIAMNNHSEAMFTDIVFMDGVIIWCQFVTDLHICFLHFNTALLILTLHVCFYMGLVPSCSPPSIAVTFQIVLILNIWVFLRVLSTLTCNVKTSRFYLIDDTRSTS